MDQFATDDNSYHQIDTFDITPEGVLYLTHLIALQDISPAHNPLKKITQILDLYNNKADLLEGRTPNMYSLSRLLEIPTSILIGLAHEGLLQINEYYLDTSDY